MKGPKVTVIGAGSYFFGKPVIHKMATSPVMAGGTLALVDTDPKVLRTMVNLARRACGATRCGVKVTGSTDRREAMKDSDFIVLTFSYRNAHYRGVDTQIAARHGIRMCSSDTIGPGGIFRALREIPYALAMARDARRLAPNAWMINFVNPTTVMGIALMRHAPDVRTFALCDGHHEPYHGLHWCREMELIPAEAKVIPPDVNRRLDFAVGGVNHCTAIVRFRYDGRDLMPAVRQKLVAWAKKEKADPGSHSKGRYNYAYLLELFDLHGVYYDAIGHTKEYVPYFQGYGVAPNRPEPIALFDADRRSVEMAEAWRLTTDYAEGRKPLRPFLKKTPPDHATDIIESMWGQLGKQFYINSANRGAVTNLPADAFLELRSDIDMRGPRPHPFGAFPRGMLSLQQRVLDTHELTAEAAVTGDRALLKRAMLADPIVNNIVDAERCIADLLAAERDVLPAYWYRRR